MFLLFVFHHFVLFNYILHLVILDACEYFRGKGKETYALQYLQVLRDSSESELHFSCLFVLPLLCILELPFSCLFFLPLLCMLLKTLPLGVTREH